jgi:hypothetical protein
MAAMEYKWTKQKWEHIKLFPLWKWLVVIKRVWELKRDGTITVILLWLPAM